MFVESTISFMELMLPGLISFMIFYVLADRKINIYFNLVEIFFYTSIINLISSDHMIKIILSVILGVVLSGLQYKERFYRFARYINISKKNNNNANVLFSYIQKNEERLSVIYFRDGTVLHGQITYYSETDKHIIIMAPRWLKNKEVNELKSNVVFHKYISLKDVKYIDFLVTKKEKKKLLE